MRARQHTLGTWQEDAELAEIVGIAASQISGYKSREEAPNARRTLALAQACGVDPGWLGFGEASEAPAPEGFAAWLARRYPPNRAAQSAEPHVKLVRRSAGKKRRAR
jgi:transcriptional regulator with XRE-family HTH domain